MLFDKSLYGKKGSFKYFIRFVNETDAFPAPLFMKFPRTNGYTKHFDNNKNKSFSA